ncbi:hypothetical protein BVAVS116_H0098 (plasmid) [Borreliella valaisiana VS116]|uniref:Uncharacterized protein n=1 Tax=Borreliella valaisiana VS116 TaxID=445987 RepID=C0R913_BORVA|nr:hypothetical protein BVAVS116_H0098 [Borreliella valaisiana VS116]
MRFVFLEFLYFINMSHTKAKMYKNTQKAIKRKIERYEKY